MEIEMSELTSSEILSEFFEAGTLHMEEGATEWFKATGIFQRIIEEQGSDIPEITFTVIGDDERVEEKVTINSQKKIFEDLMHEAHDNVLSVEELQDRERLIKGAAKRFVVIHQEAKLKFYEKLKECMVNDTGLLNIYRVKDKYVNSIMKVSQEFKQRNDLYIHKMNSFVKDGEPLKHETIDIIISLNKLISDVVELVEDDNIKGFIISHFKKHMDFIDLQIHLTKINLKILPISTLTNSEKEIYRFYRKKQTLENNGIETPFSILAEQKVAGIVNTGFASKDFSGRLEGILNALKLGLHQLITFARRIIKVTFYDGADTYLREQSNILLSKYCRDSLIRVEGKDIKNKVDSSYYLY